MRDIAIDLFKAIDTLLRLPQNAYPRGDRDAEITVTNDVCYDKSLPEVCLMDLYFPPPEKLEPDLSKVTDLNADKSAGIESQASAAVQSGIKDSASSDAQKSGTQPKPAAHKSKKTPLLLYIHGGGFVAGGKQYREGISRWYAGHGVMVANVNYGLCPDYQYPDPLRHLIEALDFVGKHAAKWGVDKRKVIVSGDSAGAYYAAMLAAASANPRFCEILGQSPQTKIAAAILDCGLYDIELTIQTKFLFNVDEQIFERFTGMLEKNFDHFQYRELCSPIHFVTPDFPPTFVQYAKKDLFCHGQGEKFVEKLAEQGVPHDAYFSNSLIANHCFPLNWKDSHAKKANAALLAFLTDFLSGKFKKRARKKS